MQFHNSRGPARRLIAFTLLSIPALAAGHAAAADYKVGSVEISQPWARATPKGAADGAAYMTATNNGTRPVRFDCVSSDAAAKCQIHSMTIDNGVMRMRPVSGGLEIKPGETVTFKPGGYHVMLVNLKEPLQPGRTVVLNLKTDDDTSVKVEFPIVAIGAQAPGAPAGGGSMGGTMTMGNGGGMMMQQRH